MHAHDDNENSPEERLLDMALTEKLSGRRPPDLKERILAALRGETSPRLSTQRGFAWSGFLAYAVSACLLFGLSLAAFKAEIPIPERVVLESSGRLHGVVVLHDSNGLVMNETLAAHDRRVDDEGQLRSLEFNGGTETDITLWNGQSHHSYLINGTLSGYIDGDPRTNGGDVVRFTERGRTNSPDGGTVVLGGVRRENTEMLFANNENTYTGSIAIGNGETSDRLELTQGLDRGGVTNFRSGVELPLRQSEQLGELRKLAELSSSTIQPDSWRVLSRGEGESPHPGDPRPMVTTVVPVLTDNKATDRPSPTGGRAFRGAGTVLAETSPTGGEQNGKPGRVNTNTLRTDADFDSLIDLIEREPNSSKGLALGVEQQQTVNGTVALEVAGKSAQSQPLTTGGFSRGSSVTGEDRFERLHRRQRNGQDAALGEASDEGKESGTRSMTLGLDPNPTTNLDLKFKNNSFGDAVPPALPGLTAADGGLDQPHSPASAINMELYAPNNSRPMGDIPQSQRLKITATANGRVELESSARLRRGDVLEIGEGEAKEFGVVEVVSGKRAVARVKSGVDTAGLQGQAGVVLGRLQAVQPVAETAELAKAMNESRPATPEPTKIASVEKTPAAGTKAKEQTRTWKPAKATPNASRLMVGEHDGLPLVGMQSSIQVDGFRARVVTDYYFHNDRPQQLEGSFQLRLPNEAALYYFAFGETAWQYTPQVESLAAHFVPATALARSDAGRAEEIFRLRSEGFLPGSVKEARMVPREQAAYAYSETTRRRVDPALVEWAGAGVFQARVFPLAGKKLHRIVVGYDVTLAHVGDDLAFTFDLPEDRGECAVDLGLAPLPGRTAKIVPEQPAFVANGRAFYHFEKIPAEHTAITVNIAQPGTLALSASDSQAGPFFATEVTAQLPVDVNVNTREAAPVGSSRGVFLLDTSLSSQPEKFNTYVKLLERALEQNRKSLRQFALLTFNVETRWWREAYVENTPENAKAAVEYCHTLALEGATDLASAFAAAANPAWRGVETKTSPKPDLFLLSDGHATWGELNPQLLTRILKTGHAGNLFAYNTGHSGTAVALLEHCTRECGGAVFAVTRAEEIEAAAVAHQARPWQLAGVTVAGGRDLLVAGRPQVVYPGQRLTIVGRGSLAQGAEVRLQLQRADEQHTVLETVDLVVPTELALRTYGQVAVGQIEELGEHTTNVAAAFARHFRITGNTCSLLMLESEADYQRYNIKPEDDSFVVSSTLAGELVTKKLDELAAALANPKQTLLAWLKKLEKMPGVQAQLSTAFQLAFEKMPESSFALPPSLLVAQTVAKPDIPAAYAELLSKGELNYTAAVREAERRQQQHGAADALKCLSSLVELSPGDPVLLRDIAFSALEWKQTLQAVKLLERAAQARPYEPQTYLALGRALAESNRGDLALVYYELAVAGQWDSRFGAFPRIARAEYAHVLRRMVAGEIATSVPEYAQARFNAILPETGLQGAGLVVTLQWNRDRTDVDLHVVEPSGEECMYNHASTAAGGAITSDVTQGFGPEMYSISKPPVGRYVVKLNYYGSDTNRLQATAKAYVTAYENFGQPNERVTNRGLTLSEAKELREVWTLEVKP